MSDPSIHRRQTQYGFEFGSAVVERLWHEDGHVTIEVRSPKDSVQIRVTKTGFIRLFPRPKTTT